MPDEINAEELALRRIQEEGQRTGTFQMVFEGGKFKGVRLVGGAALHMPDPNEIMPWHRAKAALADIDYRTHEIFRPGIYKGTTAGRKIFEGGTAFPGSGWYRYPAIEGFSRALAEHIATPEGRQALGIPHANVTPQIVREGSGLESYAAAEALSRAFQREGGKFYGLPVLDQDAATRLAFGYVDKDAFHELEFGQIMNFLRDKMGFYAEGGEKVFKRMKALMSLRGLGNLETGTGDTFFKVGIKQGMTKEKMFEALTAAQRDGTFKGDIKAEVERLSDTAWDGTSMVREDVIHRQIQLMEDQALATLEQLKDLPTDDAATRARKLVGRRQAKSMLDKIGDKQGPKLGTLRSQVKEGRLFGNARIMGLNVMDLDQGVQATWATNSFSQQVKVAALVLPATEIDKIKLAEGFTPTQLAEWKRLGSPLGLGPDDLVQGQIRGDIRVITRDVMKALTGGRTDIEILAGREAVAPEIGFGTKGKNGELIRGMARFFSIEPHKAHDVMLDVQSLSSMPLFFGKSRLVSTAEQDFEDFAAGKKPFEDAKAGLLRMAQGLEDRMADPDLMPTDLLEQKHIEQSLGYVRRFKDAIEMGLDPRQRGDIMIGMMSSYRRQLTAKSKDGLLQPRFRVPDARAAGVIMADQLGWAVPEDTIAYNAKFGTWVFHERTWGNLVKNFGGADLDDTLVNMLRMDEDGKLKALLYRQPNALNEMAVMNVDPGDAFVHRVLRSKGLTDFGLYDTAYKEGRSARQKLSGLNRQADDLLAKLKVKAKGGGVIGLRGQVADLESEMFNLEAKLMTPGARAGLSEAQIKQQMGQIRTKLPQMKTLLEKVEAAFELHDQGLADAVGRMSSYVAAQGKAGRFERVSIKEMASRAVLGARDPVTGKRIATPVLQGLYETPAEAITRGAKNLPGDQVIVARDPRVSLMSVEGAAQSFKYEPKQILNQLTNYVKNRGALGRYSNFRMMMDSWLNGLDLTDEQLNKIDQLTNSKSGLKFYGYGGYNLVEQEKAIDMAIRGNQMQVKFSPTMGYEEMEQLLGGFTEEELGSVTREGQQAIGVRISLDRVKQLGVRQMINDAAVMREALGDEFVEKNMGLDSQMVQDRLETSGSREVIDETLAHLRGVHGLDVDYSKIQTSGFYSEVKAAHRGLLATQFGEDLFDEASGKIKAKAGVGGEALERVRAIGFPAEMLQHPAALDFENAGQEMLKTFFDSVENRTFDSSALSLSEETEGALMGMAGDVNWHAVEADMMQSILPHLEDTEKGLFGGERFVGEEVYKRMTGLAGVIHAKGRGYSMMAMSGLFPSFGDLLNRTHAWSLLQRPSEELLAKDALSGLFGPAKSGEAWQTPSQQLHQFVHGNPITESQIVKANAEKMELAGLGKAREAGGVQRAADKIMGGVRRAGDWFERVSPAGLRELDTKMGRRGAAGIGILAAMGVFHAVRKKDHTAEDIMGPPNLPGGNPYMGPMGGGLDFQSSYYNYPDRGVTFEVRGRGNMNTQKFATQAQFLTGASRTSGSIHDVRSMETNRQQQNRLLGGVR